MPLSVTRFTPSPNHPWAAQAVQLVCGGILHMAPGELIDADFCIKENLMVDSCDYYGWPKTAGW